MYKHCADQVIRRCVLEQEMESILNHCHTLACGGGGGGGGTLGVRGQLQRYFNWDSTSLVCSRMLTSLCLPVINAKECGASQNGMNHPCRPS